MKKNITVPMLILFCSVAFFGLRLQAFPQYLKAFAADPDSRMELRSSCATCHVNPNGGGPRNPFGTAFAAAGYKITPQLKQQFPNYFSSPSQSSAQSPVVPVAFVASSDSQAVVEISGKKYLIDTKTRTVREVSEMPAPTAVAAKTPAPKTEASPVEETSYHPMDVRVINLPTGKALPKGSLVVDFTHRFPFNDYDVTDVGSLFGLDGFAVPSFGVSYGITDRIQVGAYRSSDAVGKPLEVYAGLSLLDEQKKQPVTALARVGLEGRDNFQRNFTTSFELVLARSIKNRAQLYFVPTLSLGNRPFGGTTRNLKGETTFAIGVGGALTIRPTVALLAEANWRVNDDGKLGATGPVYGFGIQKETISRKHAFSLIFTNGIGTTMGQRSANKNALFGPGGSDSLAIGFNLSRRIF